jgi:hypothetical protein
LIPQAGGKRDGGDVTRAVFSEENLFSAKFPLVGKYRARMQNAAAVL